MKLEIINEILKETKESYNRNLENSNRIDSKIEHLFTFITALIVLFVNIIKIPNTLFLSIIYSTTISLFILSLFPLIRAYESMEYLAIDPNKLIGRYMNDKYKSRIDIIQSLAGTTAENINSIKDNINYKIMMFRFCTYLIIIAFVFLAILKMFQG